METRFALLLACFFLSGFAALLFETAWTRELAFVFGTSELAVAAVLAAYMGGLALGAAAAARLAPRLRRPLLVYGLLELSIAACALAVPAGIRGVTALYVALAGGAGELPEGVAPGAAAFQLLGAFAVLLPPTALMGATLPLLARHAVRQEAEIGLRVGLLYATNTAGAIAGTLCAAFLLMPELGLRRTVYAGAAVNLLVFAAASALARRAPWQPPVAETRANAPTGPFWILPALALSGAVSFAYEVMWTRLLSHVLGSSVTAFATMLASFLLGIALGSAAAARLARNTERATRGFAAAQLGIAAAAVASFALADRLPDLARSLSGGAGSPLAGAIVAGAALLPLTLCVGATFPFAVCVLARRTEQAAAASARAYAWNTLGAIAGALGAGFVLLPGLGFAGTLCVGVASSLALAVLAALRARPPRPRLAFAAAALGLLFVLVPPRPPSDLLRTSPVRLVHWDGEVVYTAVGRSSSVLLLDQGSSWRLLTNGLPESVIERPGAPPHSDVAHWLGLLPALARPEAREALLVGLGGGLTLQAMPSTLERIDVVELEPEVVAANRAISDARANDPLADPRARIHLGDARGALLLTNRRYDVVVSQPSHPWTAGASHLYTREFFALVRSRLRPGGVFAQWIGAGMVDAELLQTLVATLLEVFPHVEVFRPLPAGLVFVASDSAVNAVAGARSALDSAPDDFARHGIHRAEDVAAALVLRDAGARAFAAAAPVNTDDHNLVATRAAHLGEKVLDVRSLDRLLAPHDPWLIQDPGLDHRALIRRLAGRGRLGRAATLAGASEGAAREAGLGWVALARARPRMAAQHFSRALALDPGDPDALQGLLASRREALARAETLPGIPEDELDGPVAALLAGWRLGQRGDWPAVSSLDGELSRFAPGDPLFEQAARLRIRWRLDAGSVSAGTEALELADVLVARGEALEDIVLRAHAARSAGRPDAAWSSLEYLAARLPPNGGRVYARRALALAGALPETPAAARVRAQLAARGR